MKNVKALIVLLSVALNVAFVAAWAVQSLSARSGDAQVASCGGPDSVGCPLYRQLGVTPDQWQKIEPRLKEFQDRSREECLRIDKSKEELIDLVAAPEPDSQAIGAKQKDILAGHEKMQVQLVDHLVAEKKVLTQDQQKRLFDMMRQRGCGCHGPKRGTGCGKGRGEPGCPGCGQQR